MIGGVGADINPVASSHSLWKKLWRIIRWPLLCLCAILLIAWFSVPRFDGPYRRQFANEAVSVARLRTINRLQAAYSAAHPSEGFACELSRLKAAERPKDSDDDPEEFLVSGTRTGYRFVIVNCRASDTGVVNHYQIAAVPIELGRSGFRAFCTNDSGLLWYDSDGSTEGCLALRHPLE
jgi:hypothetical protein